MNTETYMRAMAAQLAEKYSLDREDVFSVMEPMATGRYKNPLDEARLIADNLKVVFRRALKRGNEPVRGIETVSQAFTYLQGQDMEMLGCRVSLTAYMADEFTPLYSLEELTDLTEAFIVHLELNKKHILDYGSGRPFEKSIWLNDLLSNLQPDSMLTGQQGWLMEHMLRENLLNLKVRILRECLKALEARDADDLWPQCLKMLTDSLLVEDVSFFYPRRIELPITLESDKSGGLFSLLSFIGHCENEIKLQTMHTLRGALGNLVGPSSATQARLPFKNYFKYENPEQIEVIDKAVDKFLELEVDENKFWANFNKRVSHAIKNEFPQRVEIRIDVKSKHIAKFEPFASTLVRQQNAQLEATGSLSTLEFKTPVSTMQERHAFKKNGNGWLIDFEGEIIPFEKNLVGVQYVYQLILQKNKSIRPLELVRAITGNRFTGGMEHIDKNEKEILQSRHVAEEFAGNVNDFTDPKTIKACKKKRSELEADILEAERNNDLAQKEIAVTELEKYNEYLLSNVNIKGRSRKNTPEENARKAVTSRIIDFKKSIAKFNKTSDHFKCLSTGAFICYDPRGNDWEWDL